MSFEPPKLTHLQNLSSLTIQFHVYADWDLPNRLGYLDRVTLLLETLLLQFTKIQELRLILLKAGSSGFAANFWDKMNVLLGPGELVRGQRRDGSVVGKRMDSWGRTDEWVWMVNGEQKGLRKVKDVRREGVVGQW
jgi:hypothetical protein